MCDTEFMGCINLVDNNQMDEEHKFRPEDLHLAVRLKDVAAADAGTELVVNAWGRAADYVTADENGRLVTDFHISLEEDLARMELATNGKLGDQTHVNKCIVDPCEGWGYAYTTGLHKLGLPELYIDPVPRCYMEEVGMVMNYLAVTMFLMRHPTKGRSLLEGHTFVSSCDMTPPDSGDRRKHDLLFVITRPKSKKERKWLQGNKVKHADAKANLLILKPAVVAKAGTPNPKRESEYKDILNRRPMIAWANESLVAATLMPRPAAASSSMGKEAELEMVRAALKSLSAAGVRS